MHYFNRSIPVLFLICTLLSMAACSGQPGNGKNTGNTGKEAATGKTGSQSNVPLQVIDTQYAKNPRIISIASVKDFGAKGDGQSDDTEAFFKAIKYAESLGGGSIYVPEGTYVLTKALTLPRSVFLFGVWHNPDQNPEKINQGSILLCKADQGDFVAKPFISAGAGAGAIGLTIYYPNQAVDFPYIYPAALGAMDAADGKSSGFATFRYITLINPYQGIALGPNGNECHVVSDIYMTPLDKGVFINMTTDIGRIENLHISSKYYAFYDKKIDIDKLHKTMKENATGLIMQRSDWQHVYDISIEDVNTGIRFEKNILATGIGDSGNANMVDIRMSNVKYGIMYQYSRKMGSTFTDIEISTDGSPDSACIRYQEGYNSGSLYIGGVLENKGGPCIIADKGAKGAVSLSNIQFKGYVGEAVKMEGSSLSLTESTFDSPGTPAVRLLKGAAGATLDKNKYSQQSVINDAGIQIYDGKSPYTSTEVWKQKVDLGNVPLTVKKDMVVVTDAKYGAVADEKTDNTKAFQTALDAMAKKGGGIVYVPAGKYLLSGVITIPTGVELRGVSESGHHTTALGTVLFTTQGKGKEEGEAFISMKSSSGLKGVTIWYPEQEYSKPKKYPYTIRGLGQDIWIVNVTISNGWQGIDLASYDCGGHYLQFVTGCLLRNILTIDQSSKKGYVLNCHFNPHFYGRTSGTRLPGGSDEHGVEKMMVTLFGKMDKELQKALILGETQEEQIFEFFNYRQKTGLNLVNGKNGKSFDGIIILSGFDATRQSISSQANLEKDVPIISFTTDGASYGKINNQGNGVLAFIGSAFGTWNDTTQTGLEVIGGNVLMKQNYIRTSAYANGGTFISSGGLLEITGGIFNHVGAIDPSNTDFTIQKKQEVIDYRDMGGKANFSNNVGIEHFGNSDVTEDNVVASYGDLK